VRAMGVFSVEVMAVGIEKALKDAAGQVGLLYLLLSVLGLCIAYLFGTWILFYFCCNSNFRGDDHNIP